ncbi:tetratricopeptide repeat protein [Coxiella endosymbiont of Ornithodoros maritimus]|uniref:tetratricopeptide repeat protein n=1 Tax=Coxiella endosymbiont of Ornithodoros maritimus TaxID=1656172 RepID=UPI002263F00B|nr:hypothetical protein [Coxiella endosymbiont of Ornithodoros maritimus]
MRIWPRTIHYYEQSQRFFGEHHESVYNLAFSYLENNDKNKASECSRRALSLNPSSKDAKHSLEYIENVNQEFQLALPIYSKLFNHFDFVNFLLEMFNFII